MTTPLRTRVYVMTVAVLVSVVGSGACFGFVLDGWVGAVVGATTTSLGAGFGMLVRPRPAATSVQAVSGDGYAEGIADTVLLSIAMYEAAVFPLTPAGASDEEQEARRTVAYRLSAYDGLPRSVRVSAAAALEALDDGVDAERARTAVKELSLAVYECRSGRSLQGDVTDSSSG
ncbi:hypothetical protein [Streptomyces sp. NEAU-W12]|uniref:hypothetical protein n=1 Tax=Streptomyces sp. NEAU-W12 TaxID=2994668 RepID=UPI00224A5174|nr:hypothetical protein [Streptomyces sp. NEAU-W12]MCX2928406.1 hypothetical protein [Streptomyces sp. NEAU-W12]